MRHPSFVRRGIVIGIGTEFEPDEILLDAVVVVHKSFRQQAYQLLQLLLILVVYLLDLQLQARIMQKAIHARLVLLPLV
jgi:hypothetical protein